ncbi:MAG: adenylate/guanylate cyclase domain-containing protein [Caldithrix sp.]|nr:MAG: adenylate/guanylate cyclase domain-containing protein [Caldithrix sp.]
MSQVRKSNNQVASNSKPEFTFSRSLFSPWRILPIRIKLSLIIATIVVFVLTAFSLIILQNQKVALMQRMNQVCRVLIESLAETAKGGLLLNEKEGVTEAVFRLKKTSIDGLQRVAILNRRAETVASFDVDGQEVKFTNAAELLRIPEFTVRERPLHFEYYYPITHQMRENSRIKDILLGVAFISFSKKSILLQIKNARNIAIGSAIFVTLVSIFFINLIARKMTKQIQMISDGARAVSNGNLNVVISVNSKDELGQLAAEFNNMIQQLREKLQMQKFVSKLTVQMIKDTVSADGKKPRAANQKVTVLFSDVRNFSSIAEQLKPEEIVKLINIYFDLQTRIIESHKGIVDKFMGDQIMAIFQGRAMADNALLAAVEIQRQIRLINHERDTQGKAILEIGIGINNGSAVLGNMGSADRMDYTVIGDVVNVAARLCAKAAIGQIIMSYDLANKVNGSYPTSRLKSLSVKGRVKKIDVCEVDYNREILA